MSEGETDLLKVCLALAAALLLIVPAIIWQAYVGNTLWGWFISPLTGIAAPGIAAVFGAFLFLRLAVRTNNPDATTDKVGWKEVTKSTLIDFLRPAFVLLAGWITVQFV